MALYLEVHELEGRQLASFLAAACSPTADAEIRCLRHWVDGDTVALLLEAPDEDTLQARGLDAVEVTELFAPSSRWAAMDAIDFRTAASGPSAV